MKTMLISNLGEVKMSEEKTSGSLRGPSVSMYSADPFRILDPEAAFDAPESIILASNVSASRALVEDDGVLKVLQSSRSV